MWIIKLLTMNEQSLGLLIDVDVKCLTFFNNIIFIDNKKNGTKNWPLMNSCGIRYGPLVDSCGTRHGPLMDSCGTKHSIRKNWLWYLYWNTYRLSFVQKTLMPYSIEILTHANKDTSLPKPTILPISLQTY